MPATKLRLLQAHTHAGQRYAAGHVIEVEESTAAWLLEHRVAEPVAGRGARSERPGADAPAKPPSQR